MSNFRETMNIIQKTLIIAGCLFAICLIITIASVVIKASKKNNNDATVTVTDDHLYSRMTSILSTNTFVSQTTISESITSTSDTPAGL